MHAALMCCWFLVHDPISDRSRRSCSKALTSPSAHMPALAQVPLPVVIKYYNLALLSIAVEHTSSPRHPMASPLWRGLGWCLPSTRELCNTPDTP